MPATAAGLKTMVATDLSTIDRWNGQKLKKRGGYKANSRRVAAEQGALEYLDSAKERQNNRGTKYCGGSSSELASIRYAEFLELPASLLALPPTLLSVVVRGCSLPKFLSSAHCSVGT